MKPFQHACCALGLILLAGLMGCQHDAPAAASAPKAMAAAIGGSASLVPAPADAIEAPPAVFHVEIYLISVPLGTISGNEDFWRRIDEHCVDPATADLLYKNGMRVGEAPMPELEHFAKYMEGVTPVRRFTTTGLDIKDMQIEMKKELPEQLIFHFDRQNNAIGRTFDSSDNFMNFSFEPAPRKPGELRMTLCPMVRSTRTQLEWTALGNEVNFKFDKPETFYDVNFSVDLPTQSFLVVSPSPDASRATSLGHAFLVKDGATQLQEQVLLIRFDPYKVTGPAKVTEAK